MVVWPALCFATLARMAHARVRLDRKHCGGCGGAVRREPLLRPRPRAGQTRVNPLEPGLGSARWRSSRLAHGRVVAQATEPTVRAPFRLVRLPPPWAPR